MGSSVAQGLVRSDGVIGPFPVLPLLVELGDGERAGGDLRTRHDSTLLALT